MIKDYNILQIIEGGFNSPKIINDQRLYMFKVCYHSTTLPYSIFGINPSPKPIVGLITDHNMCNICTHL